ncbi:aspartate carbamoyltransferase [Treponema sp. R6D11]
MKSVYSCSQFDRARLEELWSLMDDIRLNTQKYSKTLDGKVVSTLFYEPSTRTRLSFESAVCKLGDKVISTENAKYFSSATKGESLADTIRVVQGYADAIIIRHYDDNWPIEAAECATVPIINAGAGKKEHPTQSLLDLYTLYLEKPSLDNLKICIIGDLYYGRTIHSLLELIANYDNITVYGLSPEKLALQKEYIDAFEAAGHKYVKCESFDDVPYDIDCFYSTRVQKERADEVHENPYVINKKVLDKFGAGAIVMHPLPRVDEISTDVDDDPRALYFKQAHNGVWARMALLYQSLK